MKPITITVVALEDWMTAVTTVPASTAISPFLEKYWRNFFMFSPAICCRPSAISCIPKTKKASPPITPMMTVTRSMPSTRIWARRMK